MLNSGKKIRALRTKQINILTRVIRKKNSERNKNHTPPSLQVKWSVPKEGFDYFFFLYQNENIFFSNFGNQNIF
jgi:hypothetical protein